MTRPTLKASKAGDPEVKQRPCIKCRRSFLSEHVGNRICDHCKRNGTRVYGEAVSPPNRSG